MAYWTVKKRWWVTFVWLNVGLELLDLEGGGVWSEVGEMERWNTGTGAGYTAEECQMWDWSCADGFGVRQGNIRAATVAVTNSGVRGQEVWEPLCSILNKKMGTYHFSESSFK